MSQGVQGVKGSDGGLARDLRRAASLGRNQIWADAHAHPGRSFLAGLPPDDGLVRLLGGPDMQRAVADLRAGKVRLCFAATVSDLRVLTPAENGLRAGREFAPGEAAADHHRQLTGLLELARETGCRVVRWATELDAIADGDVGLLVACEGGDFLEGQIERLAEAYERGVRSVTLVHYRVNELGDTQTEPPAHGGLTEFGREVVREMNRLGMVVDLAHATWDTTRAVLDVCEVPPILSHSHLARGDHPHPRLLAREHALAVAGAGGVVGAWPSGVALSSLDDFVDEIFRMIDLLGAEHVAIGTDMAANYRPVMSNHRQAVDLAAAMIARGAGAAVTGEVLGGNLVRLLRRVLPELEKE